MPTVSFESLTRAECAEVLLWDLFHGSRRRLLFFIAVGIAVGFGRVFVTATQEGRGKVDLLPFLGLLALVFLAVGGFWWFVELARTRSLFCLSTTVSLRPEGWVETIASAQAVALWENIRSVRRQRRIILGVTRDGKSLVVPRRAFTDATAEDLFLAEAASLIRRAGSEAAVPTDLTPEEAGAHCVHRYRATIAEMNEMDRHLTPRFKLILLGAFLAASGGIYARTDPEVSRRLAVTLGLPWLVIAAVVGLLALALLALGARMLIRGRRKTEAAKPQAFGISAETFFYFNGLVAQTLPWRTIEHIKLGRNSMFAWLSGGQEGIVVPYRTFATPEEAQEFGRGTVAFWRARKDAPLPTPTATGK